MSCVDKYLWQLKALKSCQIYLTKIYRKETTRHHVNNLFPRRICIKCCVKKAENLSLGSTIFHYYRPQRSCEGYVFTGVCLSTGGCLLQGVAAPGGCLVPGVCWVLGGWCLVLGGGWYPSMH